MSENKIELIVAEHGPDDPDDDVVAYLQLPDHPRKGTVGCVANTIRLLDIIPNHKGADIYLDFGSDGRLIGIEILA